MCTKKNGRQHKLIYSIWFILWLFFVTKKKLYRICLVKSKQNSEKNGTKLHNKIIWWIEIEKKSSDSLSADNGDHLSVGFQTIVI